MGNRGERIAAALEAQLRRCEGMLASCDTAMNDAGRWGDRDLQEILSLTKVSAQLASVIGRLEARTAGRPGATQPENRESSGSIPQ